MSLTRTLTVVKQSAPKQLSIWTRRGPTSRTFPVVHLQIRSVSWKPFSTTSTMATSTHPSLYVVTTDRAPAAIGPYSQAIKAGNLLFCSGCIPLDPVTAHVVAGGVEEQTEQALKNLKAVVEAGGSELSKVVKTTVFLKSMDDFAKVNSIYASFFGSHAPARSAVEVGRLPRDVLVEVECIAIA